jgi:hypothetical protein
MEEYEFYSCWLIHVLQIFICTQGHMSAKCSMYLMVYHRVAQIQVILSVKLVACHPCDAWNLDVYCCVFIDFDTVL